MIAVVTGAELAKVITPWVGVLTHLKGIKSAPQHAIAVERACWQGEAVCAVVGRTRAEAEDACALIDIDYEPLAAVTDAETALDPATPVIHPELADNLTFERSLVAGDPDTDAWLDLLAAAGAAGAAIGSKGPALLRSLLALLLGLAIGLGSGAPSLSGVPRFAAFAGAVSGACLLLSVLAVGVEELVVRRRQVWALHACRILSAWVIAIALLLLAYAWR